MKTVLIVILSRDSWSPWVSFHVGSQAWPPLCNRFPLVYWWAPCWPQAITRLSQDTLHPTMGGISFYASATVTAYTVICGVGSLPSLLSKWWGENKSLHKRCPSYQFFFFRVTSPVIHLPSLDQTTLLFSLGICFSILFRNPTGREVSSDKLVLSLELCPRSGTFSPGYVIEPQGLR